MVRRYNLKIEFRAVHGLEYAAEDVRMSFNSESAKQKDCFSAGVEMWEDDVKLLSGLIAKGDSHAKVMREVVVWMVIEAPRYWWQEFDTYRVGVMEMSTSTMHKILASPLTLDDFERGSDIPLYVIDYLNSLIRKGDLLQVKKNLPESFLQKRAVCFNYQVLRHIYFDRKNHKLPEWHTFIDTISLLPFYEEFIKIPYKRVD